VRADDFDVDTVEEDSSMKSGSAHRLDVVIFSVALLYRAQLVGKR
jgi:hypothetical protein